METKNYQVLQLAETIRQIASERGGSVDHLKLQKLCYFAEGWYLAFTNNDLIEELVVDTVEAWKYGPVYPVLYYSLRIYGANKISESIFSTSIEDSEIRNFLIKIWEAYGNKSPLDLVALTHAENTPWRKIYEKYKYNLPDNKDILKTDIKQYFLEVLRKSKKQ